jgi:hypothetical protein
MNENTRKETNENVWRTMGSVVNEAAFLYTKELEEYLDWSRKAQKEIMDSYWSTLQMLLQAGTDRTVFFGNASETPSSHEKMLKKEDPTPQEQVTQAKESLAR